MPSDQSQYYLQVVRTGESPVWPAPESELLISSQEINPEYTQYWAYPKDSSKEAEDKPHAEVVAGEYPTADPVILIDQLHSIEDGARDYLELIIARNGHAWGKTESSLENLEDNLTSTLDFANSKFGLKVNHFMTTKRVSEEVEGKLDNLEKGQEAVVENTPDDPPGERKFSQLGTGKLFTLRGQETSSAGGGSSSKVLAIILTVAVLVTFVGGAFIFRDKIVAKLNRAETGSEVVTPTPTPEPAPTPTPTPVSVDRSQFKVRVLNGTTKTGAASALADKLKSLGWQIQNIGNAVGQDTPKTLVRSKTATDSAVVLVADLASDLLATATADLRQADRADLEVVIGKE